MDQIIFLGTAGARVTVAKQLRASGGIWITLDDTQILVDPGPGSLVKCVKSRPKLDPTKLDGIILSHRHLDHSADINVMIEAMTDGGYNIRGTVFAPLNALEEDPVILRYIRGYVKDIQVLIEKGKYTLKNISIETPVKHLHAEDTFGINFIGKEHTISYVTDTNYFDLLPDYYKGDVLILNVARKDSSVVYHLCLDDAIKIIKKNKPKLTILTHFGMTMLKAKPWVLAEQISKELGVKVVAANDGMRINL
ncbi:MAG: MBL fold metallo-hydrolase [bacterium]|nr:MBL fold metallo-hydrolase [bacterium]